MTGLLPSPMKHNELTNGGKGKPPGPGGPGFVSRSWDFVAVESSLRRSKAKAIRGYAAKAKAITWTPLTT
jgi:hypothetical protein